MIYQYIKELIENNNRIIIPDFGAFMVQNTAEGKQISFNDFLKFNDGLLVNQIIKAEKVSKSQAGDAIKAFVSEIEKSFSQNKAFEVIGVGFLVKDDHGNIKFESKVDQKADEATTPPEVREKVKEPEVSATDSTPIIELASEEVEKPTEPIKKEVKNDTKPSAPAAEVKKEEKAEEKVEITKTPIPTRPVAKAIPKKPIPSKPNTAAKANEKPIVGTTKQNAKKATTSSNKQRNNNGLLIVIIAIVLIGGTTGAYFMGWFGNNSEPVAEAPVPVVAPIDTVVEDTTPVQEEPKVIEEPDHDPNAKKYYIVAGSFKVPNNAEAYQQKLIDDGFDSEIIIRNNGFHTVSYKTIYDWHEALSEWKNMRASNEQTWILVR